MSKIEAVIAQGKVVVWYLCHRKEFQRQNNSREIENKAESRLLCGVVDYGIFLHIIQQILIIF